MCIRDRESGTIRFGHACVSAGWREVLQDVASSSPIEVNLYNPAARRHPGGIWNEEALPVAVWEDAEHRVVLPKDLQQALGIDAPVLRWSAAKRELVLHQRPKPVSYTHLRAHETVLDLV